MAKAGRKGKYEYWLTDDGLLLLAAWARDGLTNEQMAKNVGITRETLNQWKNKFPVISDALKRSKAVADIEVENALHKKALSGDTTAMIFWLKNRKPEKWRDRDRKAHELAEQELELKKRLAEDKLWD